MNQKILKILQINGFIDGFFFFNNQKILVILNIHQKVMQYNVFLDLKILQNINLMVAVGINLLGITIYYFYNTPRFINNKQLLLADTAGIPLVGIYNYKIIYQIMWCKG